MTAYREITRGRLIMDPELMALATTAATTVVSLLTTDGWEKAKHALGALWRQVHPERAGRIEAAVVDSREDALAARKRGDAETEKRLAVEWELKLCELLAAKAEVADLLRELMKQELQPALEASTGQTTTTTITVRADARDHSQSFASGGKMIINTPRVP
jgi:hypothetical protein